MIPPPSPPSGQESLLVSQLRKCEALGLVEENDRDRQRHHRKKADHGRPEEKTNGRPDCRVRCPEQNGCRVCEGQKPTTEVDRNLGPEPPMQGRFAVRPNATPELLRSREGVATPPNPPERRQGRKKYGDHDRKSQQLAGCHLRVLVTRPEHVSHPTCCRSRRILRHRAHHRPPRRTSWLWRLRRSTQRQLNLQSEPLPLRRPPRLQIRQ